LYYYSDRILKTVDSIYEDVADIDACRELCLDDKERCNSYDYGDVGDKVCRLSHHTAATLTQITDPYQDMEKATTYEMSACYNIEIDCLATSMVAKVRSTKVFNGKVRNLNFSNLLYNVLQYPYAFLGLR
jgi:hypothetical protein